MGRLLVVASSAGAMFALAALPGRAQTPAPPTLSVALVVRVEDSPLLEPNGQPAARDLAPLEATLRELQRVRVPVALSLSPEWIDELLVAGQTRVYTSLVALGSHHPILRTPYANVLLPHLGAADAVRDELARGDAAVQGTLEAPTQHLLDPPGLALSDNVLRGAAAQGITATLAPASVTGDAPVRSHSMTLVPATTLPSGGAQTAAGALVQRYGTTGRVAVVASASPGLANVIDVLAADKRLTIVNVGDLVAHPTDQDVTFDAIPSPPRPYSDALGRADRAVAEFGSYTLPANANAKHLRLLADRARATADWQRDWDAGTRRADNLVSLVGAEESLLSAADGSVTLTSRRGDVPVTLVNRAQYPVRVRVRVTSPKLTFPRGDTRVVTISPTGVTITFVAEARSTGSFPMSVLLTSPDGSVDFAGGRVVVRSTAANVLALVLTISGAIFLIGWSSRDLLRRFLTGRRR